MSNDLILNVSNLEEGMIVKNYKKLCELIGAKPVTGKQKKLQLEDFKRYFDYEKIEGSQKLIINEVYDQPKAKDHYGNHNVYVKSIEVVLLYYLSKRKGYSTSFTKFKLWRTLGMINNNYKTIPDNKLKELDYSITDWEINHFYSRVNSRLTTILKTAMENLKNRFVIEYETEWVIVDENGKYHIAEDLEVSNILAIRYKAMKELGKKYDCEFEDERQLFVTGHSTEFYKLVNYYQNDLYNWKYAYKQFKILFCDTVVKDEIPIAEKKLHKELLNNNIVSAIDTSAKRNFETNRNSDKKFRLPDTYLQAQKILSNALLKIEDKQASAIDYLPDDLSELDAIFGM